MSGDSWEKLGEFAKGFFNGIYLQQNGMQLPKRHIQTLVKTYDIYSTILPGEKNNYFLVDSALEQVVENMTEMRTLIDAARDFVQNDALEKARESLDKRITAYRSGDATRE